MVPGPVRHAGGTDSLRHIHRSHKCSRCGVGEIVMGPRRMIDLVPPTVGRPALEAGQLLPQPRVRRQFEAAHHGDGIQDCFA